MQQRYAAAKVVFMTPSSHPTNTRQPRVLVVGEGPAALELAFRLRFKLGPKTSILLVPEPADWGSDPQTDDSQVRRALNRS
jgi:hypothetical protein